MTKFKFTLRSVVLACTAMVVAGPTYADMAGNVSQAVNFFQNAEFTGGKAFTVDVKGPVEITDKVELPGFAFNVYDVDFTTSSLTMTLVADLAKLKITLYDDVTFDRYFFAFDQEMTSAELASSTDANFAANVEIIKPGTTVTSSGAFMDGLPTEFTFDNGGILITIGEGTDLNKISESGGSLTVNF